jgi:hypothetical protein
MRTPRRIPENSLSQRWSSSSSFRSTAEKNYPSKSLPVLKSWQISNIRPNVVLPKMVKFGGCIKGGKWIFGVNTLPSRYGEKVCLRILDNSSTQLGLDKLITESKDPANRPRLGQSPFWSVAGDRPAWFGEIHHFILGVSRKKSPWS